MSSAIAPTSAAPTAPANGIDGPMIHPRPPTRPGFDLNGAPLPDDQVWKGFTARNVDTGKSLSKSEMMALGMAASQSPAEFVQRLLADSANGTKVQHAKTYRTDYGHLKIEVSVDNGVFDAKASITPYKKYASGTLGDILTKKPAKMPTISLSTTAQLTQKGSLRGVKLALDVKDLPAIDAKKVAREKESFAAARKALRENAKSKRLEGVIDTMTRIFSQPEVFLPLILADMADDSQGATLRLKPDDFASTIALRLGSGKFSVKADHLFSGKRHTKEDVNVLGTASGKVDNGKDITLESIRFETTQQIDIHFGGDVTSTRVIVDGREAKKDDAMGVASFAAFGAMALAGRG